MKSSVRTYSISIFCNLPDSLLTTTTDPIKLQEVIMEEEVKDTMQVEIE
ncbi:hypothetical protein [Bacteroides sp. 224]|nr:hypothetical protein [Bacteroides sp. 224]